MKPDELPKETFKQHDKRIQEEQLAKIVKSLLKPEPKLEELFQNKDNNPK